MTRKDHRNTPEFADTDTVSSHAEPDDDALLAQLPLISVLEAMPDAVGVYHQTGRLIFMNAAARALFQGSDEPENLHRTLRERIERLQPRNANGTPQPMERWYMTRLLSGETLTSDNPAEMYLTTLSGVERHISVTGAPITTADGVIVGAIAIVRDLTVQQEAQRRAREESARAVRELERLQVALDSAVMRLSLEDLLPELLNRARQALHSDTVTLLMLDERGQTLTVRASRGLTPDITVKVRVPVGQGFAGTIAATRKPLFLRDTAHADVVSAYLRDMLHTVVGVPLMVEDRLIGVLHVGSITPREFTPSDIWLLQQIAERVGLAIDRAQLYDAAQQAHRQTAAQARLLETVIESLAEGVILYGPDRTTILANGAYRHMMGVGPEGSELNLDYVTRGYIVAPRDATGAPLPEDQWPATRVLRGETIDTQHSQDVWLRSYDGRDALYSATGSPVYDEQGTFMGSVLALRDVTAHRMLAREATTRAAELEAIIEAMVDGLFVHDTSGGLIKVNSSGRQQLGLDEDIVLASTSQDGAAGTAAISIEELSRHLSFYDTDGKTNIPTEHLPVMRILRGETLTGASAEELIVRQTDGSERRISVSGAPMHDSGGQLLGAVMLTRDVTEIHALRSRTQESLEALLEMAEAVVSVTSASVVGPSVKQVGRRLIELARRVLGCQRIAITVVDPESGATRALAVSGLKPDLERRWWAEQTAAEQRGARLDDVPQQEVIQQLRSGQPVAMDLREPRYQGVRNEYGVQTVLIAPMLIAQRLIGFISLDYAGQAHQFTADEVDLASAVSKLAALVIERDHMLRERAAAEAQVIALEQANLRMNEFLGIAAHELRTPITVIKANLQMLMRRAAEVVERSSDGEPVVVEMRRVDRDTELLNRTEKSLSRLTRLVDDLLDVSRVHAGKLEMRIERVDLADIMREAVEEQRLAAPDRKIILDLPKRRPAAVMADAERVEQVITNYLTNALKYSSATKPVRVRLWREAKNVCVSVTDEGPGIPAEHLNQVWELFHRVPGIEVMSGSGIGLGLGLHLCRTLIERQGGEVGVRSQPGNGSTFWFSLPLLTDGEE